MADEPVVETPVVAVETPPVEPTETSKPHPLEPGGERWNEIYRERSEFKGKYEGAMELVNRLQGQLSAQPQAQPQPQKVWSEQELQALVDQGRVTPAQMASQIAIQVTAAAENRVIARITQETRSREAVTEVNDYIAKIPALNNNSSAEFAKVSRIANEIADEWGANVRDPRIQRRALQVAFGALDKVNKVEQARDFDRRHADTHVETGGGGGDSTPANKDPLKDIEPERLAHWQKLNYTREQMVEEAKFIKRPLRRIAGAR